MRLVVPLLALGFAAACDSGPGTPDADVPDTPDADVPDTPDAEVPDDSYAEAQGEADADAPVPFLFNDMALTVLENLVEHAVTPEGDWYFTATNDTVGLAPRALFSYAEALGRADLRDLAVLTAERYLTRATDILTRYLRGEDVGDEMGFALAGASSMADAYAWTADRRYLDFLSLTLTIVNNMILSDPTLIEPGGEFSIYGPLFSGGAVVALDAEVAVAIHNVTGTIDATAQGHIDQAAAMLALLDEHYLAAGGYYALEAGGAVDTRENCNMLLALAELYAATGEASYRTRALALIDALAPLWDGRGAYVLREGSTYIGLAENAVLVYAQMLLFDDPANAELLEPAEAFFAFAESELYRMLPEVIDGGGPPGHETEGGFEVILHDNLGSFGEWYWCSGCNFLAIQDILFLNRLLGNPGPVPLDEG